MTSTDPFARDDAAYVLGVLPHAEREAFENHVAGCADCRERVRELQGMPALLAGVTAADLATDLATDLPTDLDGLVDYEQAPDTLLPALLRAARARRRRGRALLTALSTVAAACVIALVITLWPTHTATPTPAATPAPAAARQFVPLVSEPISANAVLTAKKWGTEIDLTCVYSAAVGNKRVPYAMYAYGPHGARQNAGSWQQGREVTYVGGTSLALDQITKIEIVSPSGTPILRLTTG